MDQVQVNVEQVRSAADSLDHQVVIPELLGKR